LNKSIMNITSDCRIASIALNHAMILPHDANPKPDGIFGKDRSVDCIIATSAGLRELLRHRRDTPISVSRSFRPAIAAYECNAVQMDSGAQLAPATPNVPFG
jgi:hypothetical protein